MIFRVGDRVYDRYYKQYGIIKTSDLGDYMIDNLPYRIDFPDGNYGYYTRDGYLIGTGQITLKLIIKDKINKLLKIK